MAFFCFIYVAMLQTMLVFLEIYTSLELRKKKPSGFRYYKSQIYKLIFNVKLLLLIVSVFLNTWKLEAQSAWN